MSERLVLVTPPPGGRAAITGRPPAFGEISGGPPVPPAKPPVEPDPPPEPSDPVQQLTEQLAERTGDLRRLKAEYDNYRKRVRRDRLAVREVAVANVLTRLLPVLDALDAARAQGWLEGGLAAVAEVLEAELSGLGLRSVGEPGDPFDPALHKAVGGGAEGRPVCAEILRPGYRVGGQLLRPADVVVSESLEE